MGFRIVIAGESQCLSFSESCLVADFLAHNLPDFCYDRVEVPVLEWQTWLCDINLKNKWHHIGSPLVWKEMLMPGSKPYYIGGGSEFLDYCFSYYHFDSLFASHKYEDLIKNIVQYKSKISAEERIHHDEDASAPQLTSNKKQFTVTISGVKNPLSMHLISGLLEMSVKGQAVCKVYIYDSNCSDEFMLSFERECTFLDTYNAGKIVKYVNRLGNALTSTHLLIILDHVPFE